MRRRCSAPVRRAGQLGNPYSRASASWAAESVIRSETAWMRARACGSPSVAARSNSRAWRRSWSRSGRSGSSDMMSPRSPGSRLGSIRRRSCRKHDYRKNSGGGLRSCPRTQRRPPAPLPPAYTRAANMAGRICAAARWTVRTCRSSPQQGQSQFD